MFVKTYSAINCGLEVKTIEVEVDTVIGKPQFILIGLANQAVEESRERISAALLHCGIRLKPLRTIVNLAPAELRKTSSALELAIAVAMIKQFERPSFDTSNSLFLGELSLTGKIKAVKGILPIALQAKQLGFKRLFFPEANLAELALIKDLELLPLRSLQELLNLLKSSTPDCLSLSQKLTLYSTPAWPAAQPVPDLAELNQQVQAKRALSISAAGGHHLLLFGEPGAGKTYLAQSILSILPAMTEAEILELNQIYSLLTPLKDGLIQQRPFRDPHHAVTRTAFLGGLDYPGELSLAHLGVLFLDEFTEFRRDLIESLRQPLEKQFFKLNRAKQEIIYPANFTLIAATNPCPCGFYGSKKACRCSTYDLIRYQKKLSGPILDRIDLSLHLSNDQERELFFSPEAAQATQEIKQQVTVARKKQQERFKNTPFRCNANLSSQAVQEFCLLTPQAQQLLNLAREKLQLSLRSYFKVIKVAQTIADLSLAKKISEPILAEALSFRETPLVSQ